MDKHTPSGTSLGTAVQFAQNYNAGMNHFKKIIRIKSNRVRIVAFQGEPFNPYSYGLIRNLQKYGRLNPPQYDLTKVTLPVYIFYGANDLLVGPEVC